LKLILSVDALGPTLTGIGRYTWELASRMGNAPGIEQVRYFRNGRWIGDPSSLVRTGGRKHGSVIRLPRFARHWYWKRACSGQLFHSPNYFLPPYVENGIVTVHDLSVLKYPETHPVERVKQFERSFSQTLKIASHLITDTETVRQEVIEFLGWPSDKVTAVHLGVSQRFIPRTSSEISPILQRYGLNAGNYSLCVSTIEPRKKIDRLLEVYARLPAYLLESNPLVLVGGKGWQSEHLHKLVVKGVKAGWLHYLGFVPDQDLPELYAGAKLFIYPSIYEGFGLPVIEAMASGVPVITSNCSCLPEIASGAARLVNPDDSAALSEMIDESLNDDIWRQQAVSKGLEVAVRYNWDDCISRTVEVYKSQA